MTLRDRFREFCPLTEEERKTLENSAVFVLDTNVLLHTYRYSENTRDAFLAALKNCKSLGRLWIPHHVAYEFHKNRPNVIAQQTDLPQKLVKDFVEKFPFSDRSASQAKLQRVIAELGPKPTSFSDADPVLNQLHDILEGLVGEPFPDDELAQLYRTADERYRDKVPPGFQDADKPKPDRYGDFLIWWRIIDYAKATNVPVIFVTDERKSDWIWLESGKTVFMKYELRREFHRAAGQLVWIYNSHWFLSKTSELAGKALDENVRKEVSDISELAATSTHPVQNPDIAVPTQWKSSASVPAAPVLRALMPRDYSSELVAALARSSVALETLRGFTEQSGILESLLRQLNSDDRARLLAPSILSESEPEQKADEGPSPYEDS